MIKWIKLACVAALMLALFAPGLAQTATPPEATPGSATPGEALGQVKCTASKLNVRESPGTEFAVIGALYRGDLAEVLQEGDGWYLVRAGEVTGWASARYLIKYTGEAQAEGVLGEDMPYADATAQKSFTLFQNCSGSASMGDWASGQEMKVLARQSGRYQVAFDGHTGWVNAKNLSVSHYASLSLCEGFSSASIDEEIRARIQGKSFKADCTVPEDQLRLLNVLYYDFSGNLCEGEVMCHVEVSKDLLVIFHELFLEEYAFGEISLVDKYDADDRASMSANNTSCFNFRRMSGNGKLSQHAYGIAIDINPRFNPYVLGDKYSPSNAGAYVNRSRSFAGKIDAEDECYRLFISHGWTWGGHWKNEKDYQHFEKAM